VYGVQAELAAVEGLKDTDEEEEGDKGGSTGER